MSEHLAAASIHIYREIPDMFLIYFYTIVCGVFQELDKSLLTARAVVVFGVQSGEDLSSI